MSASMVTVATYSIFYQAEIARAALADENIEAQVIEAPNAFSGVVGLSVVRLQVSSHDAKEARRILIELEATSKEDRWEITEEMDEDLWVCSLCGSAVGLTLAVCPDCQTARPPDAPSVAPDAFRPGSPDTITRRSEIPGEGRIMGTPLIPSSESESSFRDNPPKDTEQLRKPIPISGTAPPPREEDISPEPDLGGFDTFLGDDLARRTFHATLISFLVPLIFPYAFWLLIRLSFFSGALSKRGHWFCYGAVGLLPVYVIYILSLRDFIAMYGAY